MFAIKHFQFDVDLGLLFGKTKRVPLVQLDGMEIYVPPKGERPTLKFAANLPLPLPKRARRAVW